MDVNNVKYYLNFPQKIICERGAIKKISYVLKNYNFSKIMIVTDEGILNSGIIDNIKNSLEENKIKYVIYSGVKPNPDIDVIDYGEKLVRKNNIDCLLGIGGGSCMDAAKAIGIVFNNEGPIDIYEGLDKYKNDPLPTIAVPTTAGTGSESTPSAVITDKNKKNKMSIFSLKGLPKVAILDPDLLQSLSANLAATTGLDALCHSIESFTSLQSTHLTDSLSSKAIELIGQYLRIFVSNRANKIAAEAMLIASNLAGISFTHTFLGDVHALAHPIGGYYNAPHGVINAILLPYVMKFNLISNPEKFKNIAVLLGENISNHTLLESAEKSIIAVQKMAMDFGIPKYLYEIGFKEEHIDEISIIAKKSRNASVNPRKTEIADFKQILKNANNIKD
jgi:alcohol dehydrogenase class IV